jgi:NAD(P)-dependent dehydrogenase (short-subunit alcohol dehydrogenase family)
MIQDFRDKVAVVTGAAGGIGAALVEGFAAEGMKVVAADLDGAGAARTAERIGGTARAVAVDVSDAGSVQALADEVFDTFGRVDLLINNAGVFQGGLSWQRSVEDWDWILGVNVYGIIHGIRSFVPRMIEQDSEGHVVNTASVAAYVAGPFSGPYVVSKCAAMSLTECLALDLAAVGSKIGASVLTPSTFDTEIAHTARVRQPEYGVDDTPDNKMTVEALASITSTGLEPVEAFAPVRDGVRSGEFLIPTKPSYANQLRARYEALVERALPERPEVD